MYRVEIMVGSNNRASGGTFYTPRKYVTHERFNHPFYANDIGLILVDKIEFNDKVQPIKYSKKFIDSETTLLATGWGRLSVSLHF